MSESGKRRPHSLFRGKKWRRFFRRMRRKADRAIGYVIGDRDRGRSRSQMSFDSKVSWIHHGWSAYIEAR
jgi:hypothetical protein